MVDTSVLLTPRFDYKKYCSRWGSNPRLSAHKTNTLTN